ncbi:MAG: hypothetical protein J6Y78_03885 [Paludibacteraceae bacterium]|nr:hypothetical protein [Paludibacteraceae bacterium]
METKYDYIVNILLNNWVVAIIVLIVVVLIAIPQIRDGLKTLLSLFYGKKEFVSEYADEKITFEVKLRSQDFDIVKIHATTHSLGVHAEREWLKKYYPGYENNMQFLDHVITDDGKTIDFDILPIYKGNKKKDIYFDITEFYNGAHVEFTGSTHRYAKQKIRDFYSKE